MQNKTKWIKIILIVSLLMFAFTVGGNAQTQLEEKIVEKVEVINVELPVRVFFKGKPVTGLTKSDFTLSVNGKKRDIHGFYEFKKKMAAPGTPALQKHESPSSRLFLLMFNICEDDPEALESLDIFFDKIFRADDRLMVITNRFFFDDRVISNPLGERDKLQKVLLSEMENVREKTNSFKRRMESMLRSFKSRLKYSKLRDLTSNEFINNYRQLVWQFKSLYLRMDDARYLQLAQYLKAQRGEKWVLSFYQVGRFFQPKWNSEFRKLLLGDDFMSASQRYDELEEVMEVEDPILDDDLSRVFADTGAAFHTILMADRGSMRNDLAADLSYKPIISGTYRLLEKIAKKTGGTFMSTNNIPEFYREIAAGHDICYMLTYVPDKADNRKKRKVTVTVKNKKYTVYYDNGKRGAHFRKLVKKKQPETPQIRIGNVSFDAVGGHVLTFIVSGFKIDEKTPVTTLPVRIQVFNRQGGSLFDGVENFTVKDLPVNKVKLQVSFPELPAGFYDIFIWVADPLTGKSDVTVKEIKKE
ncbi:MAG: hypothetical protein GY950_08950 [bacterium]|nr:hypothetical protein [bacterium]